MIICGIYCGDSGHDRVYQPPPSPRPFESHMGSQFPLGAALIRFAH